MSRSTSPPGDDSITGPIADGPPEGPGPTLGSGLPAPGAGATTATNTARNAGLLAAATLLSRLAMFALAIFMQRRLGATQYGRYGFASALAIVLVPLADIGLTPYVIREVAQARASAEAALRTMLRVKLALSVATVAVVAAVAALAGGGETMAVVLIVLAAALADGASLFVFGYFRGREKMGFEARSTTTTAFVRAIGGIILVVTTGRLVAVLIWLLMVSTTQLVGAGLRLRRGLKGATLLRGRGGGTVQWRTVAAIGSIALLTIVYTRADAVLIEWIEGSRSVGYYTAAYTLMLGLGIVPWVISSALVPVFARTRGSDPELFASSWHEGLRAVMVIALPLALAACLLARPIIVGVSGAEYAAAATSLAILAWTGPLAAFTTMVTATLRAARREDWLTRASATGVVVNIGLNLWAIPTFGIGGAAAVTVGTEVAICVVLGGLAIRAGIVRFPRLPYPGLATALGVLAFVSVLTRDLPVGVRLAAALLAYSGVAIGVRVVGRRDLDLLRSAVAFRGGR